MYISFASETRRISNHEVRVLLEFLGNKLLGRLAKTVNVTVNYEIDDRTSHGLIEAIPENGRCRDFEIYLNTKFGREELIKTICHEMVHVKQYARGELKSQNSKTSMWRGENVSLNDMEYYEYPWEIEAYGREVGLYRMYLRHLHENDMRFDKNGLVS